MNAQQAAARVGKPAAALRILAGDANVKAGGGGSWYGELTGPLGFTDALPAAASTHRDFLFARRRGGRPQGFDQAMALPWVADHPALRARVFYR